MSSFWEEFSPQEVEQLGHELAKHAAHAAVRQLLELRLSEGMSQRAIAEKIGRDPGWLSKTLRGPANWTLKTVGSIVEAMDGKLVINAIPKEESSRNNYDAYIEARECVLSKHSLHEWGNANNIQKCGPMDDIFSSQEAV
ncbi:MAG: helix-turn-helix domain-containing protein [Gluconobacter oxydans]